MESPDRCQGRGERHLAAAGGDKRTLRTAIDGSPARPDAKCVRGNESDGEPGAGRNYLGASFIISVFTVSSIDYGTITTYSYRGQPYDLATSRGGWFGSDMVLGQFLDA